MSDALRLISTLLVILVAGTSIVSAWQLRLVRGVRMSAFAIGLALTWVAAWSVYALLTDNNAETVDIRRAGLIVLYSGVGVFMPKVVQWAAIAHKGSDKQ